MFNSSFGGGGGGGGGGGEFNLFIFFQTSNFCISLPILVIPLFVWLLVACVFHSLFYLFCVSYE